MGEYSEQDRYWIWLGSIQEITPKLFYYILKEFGCPECLFDAVQSSSEQLDKLPQKALSRLSAACSTQYITELICEMNVKDVHAVTRLCNDYPKHLAKIPYPPPVLFVKGSLQDLGSTFSIVGTRRCTRRGYELTKKMAGELGQNGMTIVSGMARGIDTAAHTGAIEAGAKTVAVLGCGVDVVYPPESEEVYQAAINNGAVISELPLGMQPYHTNFPARNRIITGLSCGTLIVESEKKGGTAISAGMAIAQGRDVFAVPGIPAFAMSALPNMLIKQGAVSVCEAQDILSYYGDISELNDGKTGQQKEIQLDFLQGQIYNLLLQGDMSVQSIASGIEYPQREINVTLTMMELAGLIRRLPGGKFGI